MTEERLKEALAQRLNTEFELLSKLPKEYTIVKKEVLNGIRGIEVYFPSVLLKIPMQSNLPTTFEFLIWFDASYPLTPPAVQMLTKFGSPLLSDSRNLLYEVMGKPWTPSFCLNDLLQRLPLFILRYMEEDDGKGAKKLYGYFDLERTYDLASWKDNDVFDIYKVEDISDASKKLWIVVTEAAWLLLEGEKKFVCDT